jgi:ribokinase
MSNQIIVMGSYVADLAFRTPKLPAWGETVMGASFRLGPGGKGSNQAVAAVRAGASVSFLSKLCRDPFGDLARATWQAESIVFDTATPTGAAAILLDQHTGENAIIVVPGACFELAPDEVQQAQDRIQQCAVFLTQLELPLHTVEFGLQLAHSLCVPTILNPAPTCSLSVSIYPLCDYITPNESEAEQLTGVAVTSLATAEQAADALLVRGVGNAIITLGAQGAFVKNAITRQHIAAFDAGPIIETTGAGDAFNGAFAVALAEGQDLATASRFACAAAGISVTRPGTAPSMPHRHEIDALLNRSASAR